MSFSRSPAATPNPLARPSQPASLDNTFKPAPQAFRWQSRSKLRFSLDWSQDLPRLIDLRPGGENRWPEKDLTCRAGLSRSGDRPSPSSRAVRQHAARPPRGTRPQAPTGGFNKPGGNGLGWRRPLVDKRHPWGSKASGRPNAQPKSHGRPQRLHPRHEHSSRYIIADGFSLKPGPGYLPPPKPGCYTGIGSGSGIGRGTESGRGSTSGTTSGSDPGSGSGSGVGCGSRPGTSCA